MSNDAQRTSTTDQRALEWMRFDPVKFGLLADGMSLEEEGALIRLVRHLWNRGPLPEAEVRRVTRKAYDAIAALMVPVDEAMSLNMIEQARTHGKLRVEQRSKAGIASAEKRKQVPTTVERPLNEVPTDVLSKSKSSSKSLSEKGTAHEPEIIPEGISVDLWAALKRWEQYRKEKGNKLTPTGREGFHKKCKAWGDARAIAAIEHSISQGYTGCFEPDNKPTN